MELSDQEIKLRGPKSKRNQYIDFMKEVYPETQQSEFYYGAVGHWLHWQGNKIEFRLIESPLR